MLPKLLLMSFLAFSFAVSPAVLDFDSATAATKKKKKKIRRKSSDFTPAQRKKLMEEARKICKRRYGAGATVYRLDYYKWTVWCREH